LIERLLLGNADIQPTQKAAIRSKAAVRAKWSKLSASDPLRPLLLNPVKRSQDPALFLTIIRGINVPYYLILLSLVLVAPAIAETPEQRLKAAGYMLPEPADPIAVYVTRVRTGNLLFLSGHGECREDFTKGKVGLDLTVAEGKQSAEYVGLCMLATIKDEVGELSRVKQFVRILGMVNATEGLTEHPQVINGFSELMVVAFGENGKAARAAVGMASLPGDIAVEIEAIVELHGDDSQFKPVSE
jgi:enamine deaminase RidA (YjgF/YER057c/UK114 family)